MIHALTHPMKRLITLALFAIFCAHNFAGGFPPQAVGRKERAPAFSFSNVNYFHRFTKDDLHEYTPAGQEDLNAWTEMVTINVYRQAKDGEALAAVANAVLENYKAKKGLVVKTDSVPRTANKPAEHLIVVVFGRPEFIEAAFSRFRLNDGVGTAVTYSHRIYGRKVGDQMSAWLKESGPTAEGNLMKWDAMPELPVSK